MKKSIINTAVIAAMGMTGSAVNAAAITGRYD